MNINFQSVNYNADSKLKEFAEKRIKKISQFYLNIIDVFVYTKVENTNDRIKKLAELKKYPLLPILLNHQEDLLFNHI